jgi:hypothetical protein
LQRDAVVGIENPDYPDVGTVTFLALFIRGLAGPHAGEVQFAADRLVQSVFGEELALTWNNFILSFDSEDAPEKFGGIPRTPLPHIVEILDVLDLGPEEAE